MTDQKLTELVAGVAEALGKRQWMCVTAESCTGGGIAKALTEQAGSSEWFERGFVTYSNDAKQEMLGVSGDILARYGAVSEQTARDMAEGARRRSRAQASMAVTGIAGPSGGSPDKPVGTVAFGWSIEGAATETETRHFNGDRRAVREAAIEQAIAGLLARLQRA